MNATQLRETELLRHCTDADLRGVLARASEVRLAAGDLLFSDDDRAEEVWVLLEGDLLITTLVGGDEVVVDHLGPGAYLGEISLLSAAPAGHRARAHGDARLLRIPGDAFLELIRSCSSVMETVLQTMAQRVLRIARLLQQRERMAALGTLAAGLAHELNNPAAAAKRALVVLEEQFATLKPLARRLAAHPWSEGEIQLLDQLERATTAPDQASRELAPLVRSDRGEALAEWLARHEVERAWELAPLLVDRGVTPERLEQLTMGCDVGIVVDALAWTERMASIRQLLDEAAQSTARISEMVRAVKSYSYTDTTSLRTADVHEGLENSLTILGHKLRESRATVVREYDRALPAIDSYGTELSQVWTNLLDNAADAVSPAGGTVRVRTARDGDGAVVVEIADSGPGISPEVQPKIFDPFFTTKDAGKGTGLGLEIVQRIVARHRGTVEVISQPGNTRFVVTLPLRRS